jgi:Ca-activated chloride channel family protein
MRRKIFLKSALLLGISMAATLLYLSWQQPTVALADSGQITQGSLQAIDASGKAVGFCPLRHTDVKAEISGFLSRVVVTQEFENPFKDKIEAVYTFPLPEEAAVDDMTMHVGARTVRGRILRREEAQAVYEAARAAGQVAGLLDQERPNVFTQSVANIAPGEKVTIEISYVETLKYEAGAYEFVFPMVVAPRYMPGTPTGSRTGGGRSVDTTQVPDASRISPHVAAEGTRAGHDISVDVRLDAGVPLDALASKTHDVQIERMGASAAHVTLKDKAVIPNKDFVLRYDVAGGRIEDALLTHRANGDGFFTLILQPPDRVVPQEVTPKEIVFVLDTSGSMEGFPIEKAKESMRLALDGLYPQDTFNLITFAGDEHILFPQPVPATKENLRLARQFLRSREGRGGTEMMKAIRAALEPSDAQDHVRIVCFMTDGEVGNDMEIIGEVQKHPNARVFSFGIGSSVNRFLLDKMAEYGRGEVEYVSLNDDGSAAARRFHERIRNPLLTDISVDWNGLPVADVYPKRIPDLFSARPVILTGRYRGPASGVIRLKGRLAGQPFVREMKVDLPENLASHDVLASLWARERIDDLMGQDYEGLQHGNPHADLKETITQLGLEYRLMTQFTSFVAVEEMTVTEGGQPRRVEVPVELPEGMSRNALPEEESQGRPTGLFTVTQNSMQPLSKAVSVSPVLSMPRPQPTPAPNGPANSPHAKVKMPRRSRAGNGGGGGGASVSYGKLPVASIAGDVTTAPVPKLSPEEERQLELQRKLHPSVLALVRRLKDKEAQAASDEAAFVQEGKAELQIWLSTKSPEVMSKLKELGVEVVLDPATSKLVIGRLSVDKLEMLAALEFVRYVSPSKRAGG